MTASDDLTRLYRDTVLDHSRNPRNFRSLAAPSHTATGHNPLCGDKVVLYLDIGSDGRIGAATFEGSGCAISLASASMLTELVRGQSASAARALAAQLEATLAGADDPPAAGDLASLSGVRAYPARVRCATLAWRTLEAALRGDKSPITTERDES
jgi:nitrogen fixation NifU-like protein